MSLSARYEKPAGDSRQSYEQVGTILERIKNYHLRIIEQLSNGGKDDESLTLLRRRVLEIEEENVHSLVDYLRDGPPSVLSTWLQYIPVSDVCRVLSETDLSSASDVEEFVARKLKFDGAITDLLVQLSRESGTPEVQEVFSQLAKQAEKQAERQSWMLTDRDLAP